MTKLILALESSCDDTAAAIITSNREILANIVLSQINEHLPYQGVVPEIASRAHMNYMEFAIKEALNTSDKNFTDIDLIAATGGPGLIGGVIVGTMYAKSLASVLKKPYIAVNHLEGHALTVRLTDNTPFPYLLLLVSGGHCQFIEVQQLGTYKLLGQTLDDAVGEAFDKLAKMLNLGYPGGPIIEQRALDGDNTRFKLPLSMTDKPGCDMSFSGLKTAVRLVIEKHLIEAKEDQFINDLCASFQTTVTKILINRLTNALTLYEQNNSAKRFVIAGGVAANQYIKNHLSQYLANRGYELFSPPLKLCTDNAAMIGWAGFERWQAGESSSFDFCPRARWPLMELTL